MRWVALLAVTAFALTACTSSSGSTGEPRGPHQIVVHGDSDLVTSVPSCQWPLNVSPDASEAQAGLIRCYLQALTHRNLNELVPLTSVTRGAPITLTPAALRHAADAASGTATAVVRANDSDPFDASVIIRFANGARETVSMDARNAQAPAAQSWRLNIGTAPSH